MTQTKNIMPKHYQQLQSFERGQIESLTRFGVRQIASRLHRSPSTISRELKRGLTTQIDSQNIGHIRATLPSTGRLTIENSGPSVTPKVYCSGLPCSSSPCRKL